MRSLVGVAEFAGLVSDGRRFAFAELHVRDVLVCLVLEGQQRVEFVQLGNVGRGLEKRVLRREGEYLPGAIGALGLERDITPLVRVTDGGESKNRRRVLFENGELRRAVSRRLIVVG